MVPRERHGEFVALDIADVAKVTGIPRGFIMLMGEPGKQRPFVLGEGLLYKGEKKGYRSIQIDLTPVTDSQGQIIGYQAKATLWPKFTNDDFEVIKHLPQDPSTARLIIEELSRPFIEIGSATVDNIKMKTMIPYARELASTRARNRVLRLFTACGLTSVEELDDAVVEELVEPSVTEEEPQPKPAGAPTGVPGTASGSRKQQSNVPSAGSVGGSAPSSSNTPRQELPRPALFSEPYGADCPKCKIPLKLKHRGESGQPYVACDNCGVIEQDKIPPKKAAGGQSTMG